MAWGRLDGDAPNHPKFIQAGPLAFGVFFAGVCYANKYRTDGFIPTKALFTILPGLRHRACVAESVKLVEAGLWEVRDGGWQIHDFLKYNLSAADQREQERVNYERGVAGGRARAASSMRIRGRFVQQDHQQATSVQAGTSEPASTSPRNVTIRNEVLDLTTSSGATPDRAHAKNGFSPESLEVLTWLNMKAGKNFRPVAANLTFIDARLRDGITPAQLRAIVTRKVREWGGTDQAKYLRPETLFNRTKCEQYVGELPKVSEP